MAIRIDLVKAIARNLGDLVVDAVPASMTASTIDCLSLFQPNPGQLTGKYVYIYSGAGSGQSKVIGSFNPTLKRLVFPEGLGSIPSVNSNFILTLRHSRDDYSNAIDRYVGFARTRNLIDAVATAALVATQYEYPVPSGMEYVNTLRLVPSGNTDYRASDEIQTRFEIPPRYWRIESNVGGTRCITIDSRQFNLDEVDNYVIKIFGQAHPNVGTTDASAIPDELVEYLIAGASAQLVSTNISTDGKIDPRFYMYRDQVSGRQTAPGLEDYITTSIRGKKVY